MSRDGCKVHPTGTCEPDTVHLITNVATTTREVGDDHMLAGRNLLPGEHRVDTRHACSVLPSDCAPGPQRPDRIESKPGSRRLIRRELTLRPRGEYDTIHQTRALRQTEDWKARYKIRAGVEGTTSQGVLAHGRRRSRYRGLSTAGLQHQLTGAAINLAPIEAHLAGTPHAGTRTSHLTALRPTE